MYARPSIFMLNRQQSSTQPRLLAGRSADDWPRDARGTASGLTQNIHAEDSIAPEARLVMRDDIPIYPADDETKTLHILVECSKWNGWALLVAVGWWIFILVVLQWCSLILFQWFSWLESPAVRCGRPRSFGGLSGKCSRIQWETNRWHSLAGMQWRQYVLGRSVRRPV